MVKICMWIEKIVMGEDGENGEVERERGEREGGDREREQSEEKGGVNLEKFFLWKCFLFFESIRPLKVTVLRTSRWGCVFRYFMTKMKGFTLMQ